MLGKNRHPALKVSPDPPSGAPHSTRHRRSTHATLLHDYVSNDKGREVRVRAVITRLINVDLQSQVFTCNVQIDASWREPELIKIAKVEGLGLTEKREKIEALQIEGLGLTDQLVCHTALKVEGHDHEPLFAPKLTCKNLIDNKASEVWYRCFVDREEIPFISMRWKLTGGTFQELMELENFPGDSQDLAIELVSGYEVQKQEQKLEQNVLLKKNLNPNYRSHVNVNAFVQMSEYTLWPRLRFQHELTPEEESATGCVYPLLRISMHIDRKAGYWVLNVIIPMFIITSALFLSWSVPVTDLADRCSITLTLLLAMVAFKYIVAEKLPPISYATRIDQYVLCCFLVAFFIMVVQAGSNMGIVNEAYLVYRINATTARTDPTSSAVHNPSALRWAEVPEREAQVPAFLIYFGSAWLGAHLLAYLRILIYWQSRRVRDAFFRAPARDFWIGPLAAGADLPKRRAATAEAMAALVSTIAPIEKVHVWTPEEAAREVDESRTEEERLHLPQYVGTNSFAVVRFRHEQLASAGGDVAARINVLLQDPEHRDTAEILTPGTNACHLEMDWLVLAQPRRNRGWS